MGGWEEYERGAVGYAMYRRYARKAGEKRNRDPMDELGLTDKERTVAYLVMLGLVGAAMAISTGLVYLVGYIISAIYRVEFWEAMMSAMGLFLLFLWPLSFIILVAILYPIVKRPTRRYAPAPTDEEEGGAEPNPDTCSVEGG